MASKGEKYVIEHGVSVPGARTRTKYPWRQMKVGDSFVASYEEVDHIRSAAAYFATRNPEFAFTTRKVDADHVRVWRVERVAKEDDMFEGFDAGVRVVEERITALEERLELWAEDGDGNKVKLEIGDSDGIGCRDETIRLLDETLQQVRPENLAARIALAEKYAAAYDGDDRQDIKTDILNAIYWAWRAK